MLITQLSNFIHRSIRLSVAFSSGSLSSVSSRIGYIDGPIIVKSVPSALLLHWSIESTVNIVLFTVLPLTCLFVDSSRSTQEERREGREKTHRIALVLRLFFFSLRIENVIYQSILISAFQIPFVVAI